MYSNLKNVEIIVALLKKNNVKNIVISAGTRHTPLVVSVENDDFFTTYSIVDERSAAFFAIGLIEQLREPVAICCTSGTASANYVSAANEAFYQQLPLLILTADRNHYYMFQQEEQMIPQENLYKDVCKKVITLPHVRDEKDFWYCSRLVNEAFLELTQGEKGPVHINFIVENDYPEHQGIVKFEVEELPEVRKIERLTLEDSEDKWKKYAEKLKKSKTLIVYGQHGVHTEEELKSIESFAEKYNCAISVDLLSNLKCNYAVPTFSLSRMMSARRWEELCPDIVITMNANSVSELKSIIGHSKKDFEHWHVSAKGEVSDPFKCLPDIIACSPNKFFERFGGMDTEDSVHDYYDSWNEFHKSVGINGSLNDVSIEYSAMYATQQFMKKIPENSLLHIANSNSIRLANYFTLNNGIQVFCNRGANGIDGSMSSFVGQAHVSNKMSYLLIGDLSFFYDMNSLWSRYIGNNIRILVCNNFGGAIFHSYPNVNNVPTLDEHIGARHEAGIKDWVISRGFEYISARNKEEFDKNAEKFFDNRSEKPIAFEVFTDKEIDANSIRTILAPYAEKTPQTLKGKIAGKMPPEVKKAIKKIIK